MAKGLCSKHYYQLKREGKFVSGTNDPNHYKIRGNIVVFKTHDKRYFIISLEDLELVKQHVWIIDNRGHVVTSQNRKYITLARLIMDFPEGMQVDNRNINRLDNTRANLVVNNMHNQRNTPCTNKNGAKSVHQRGGSWGARIAVNGERFWLGSYKTKEEAVNARKEAELKYYT